MPRGELAKGGNAPEIVRDPCQDGGDDQAAKAAEKHAVPGAKPSRASFKESKTKPTNPNYLEESQKLTMLNVFEKDTNRRNSQAQLYGRLQMFDAQLQGGG